MRHTVYIVFLILSLALASPAHAAPVDRAWQTVVEDYRDALRAGGVVGSSMVLTQNGRTIKSEYYGFADKEAGRRVDAQTIYHWASITKLFTAVAVLQLRDRGKLRLDNPIVNYLPETKLIRNQFGPMSQITLRHLLTHSSGLRASTFPWGHGKDWFPREPANWSQVAAMMPYTEIEFEPGSKFSYSNPGMSMLGRVVEEITGEDLEIYITKNILMPLEMTQTYFDIAPYHLVKYRSANYEITKGVITIGDPDVDTGATKGNGGLSGPLSDLLKFAHFLLGVNDNGNYATLLSRSSIEEMETPTFLVSDTPELRQDMGLGAYILRVRDKTKGTEMRLIGHTGSQANFLSWLYIDPQSRSAAVLSMNTYNSDVDFKRSAYVRARVGLFNHVFPSLRR